MTPGETGTVGAPVAAVIPTPSQTAGPYLAIGLGPFAPIALVADDAPGAIRVVGRLTDGHGDPVPDGAVEIWQADPEGRFPPDAGAGWTGFGRSLTDAGGEFAFTTVKPGRLPVPSAGAQAPHLDVLVFARGLLRSLHTRMYFPDESTANAEDLVLGAIPDPSRRATLVAVAEGDHYRFDIRMQGAAETVFFGA